MDKLDAKHALALALLFLAGPIASAAEPAKVSLVGEDLSTWKHRGGVPSPRVILVLLVGEDLSTWRGNSGNWAIVSEVKTDPANDRRFVSSPGSGVLFNGKTGRTRDLFSKYEHGDVEAHVEFADEKPRGPLMLQGDHGPVAYRNIWLRPIGRQR